MIDLRNPMDLNRCRAFLAVLLALVATARAGGQDAKSLLLGGGSIPTQAITSLGITIIPPTTWSDGAPVYYEPPNGQLVVPRYANGGGHPAGSVIGWGPASVIQATQATAKQAVPALVITEGAGDTNTPPLYGPQFKDFLMLGDKRLIDGKEDIYAGLKIRSFHATVEGVRAKFIPGIAFDLGGTINKTPTANYQPFEGTELSVWDCHAHASNKGFNIDRVDARVGRLAVAGWQDSAESYAFRFPAGACQIDGELHAYGGGSKGVGLWLPAGSHDNKGNGPVYLENCGTAVKIDGNSNFLSMFRLHTCAVTCLDINGTLNRLSHVHARGNHESCKHVVSIDNQFNSLTESTILLGHANCEKGIVLTGNAKNHTVIERVGIYNRAGSNKTAVSVETPTAINDAIIDIHIGGFEVGIELNPGGVSKLGKRNRITVTVDSGGSVAKPLSLPRTWDDESNVVIVNGVRISAK